MRRRRVIGRFKRSKQGGWEGEIDTLTIHKRRIRLVPNDNRVSDNAPAFRVMLGRDEIGEAWEKRSRSGPEAIHRAIICVCRSMIRFARSTP